MSRLLGILALIAAFTLLVGSASAGDDAGKGKGKGKGKRGIGDPEATFKKLDANNDGKLSKAEFLKILDKLPAEKQEKAKTFLGKRFDSISKGSDSVTLEQFRSGVAELSKKKGKKKTDQ